MIETNIKPTRKEKSVFRAISEALRDANINQVPEATPTITSVLAKARATQDVFWEAEGDGIVFRRVSGGQVGYKVLATLKFESDEQD